MLSSTTPIDAQLTERSADPRSAARRAGLHIEPPNTSATMADLYDLETAMVIDRVPTETAIARARGIAAERQTYVLIAAGHEWLIHPNGDAERRIPTTSAAAA